MFLIHAQRPMVNRVNTWSLVVHGPFGSSQNSIRGTLILSNTPVPTWVKHRPTSQRFHVEGQSKYRLWVCPKVGNPIWRIPPGAPKLKLPFEYVLDYNTVYIYIYATPPRPTFCVSDMSLNALSSFLSYQLL